MKTQIGIIPNSKEMAGETDQTHFEMMDRLTKQEERYLRLAAEYDNYRKRTIKERNDADEKGQVKIVGSMVETFDDLLRFTQLDIETVNVESLAEGVEMIAKKMFKVLQEKGLEVIRPMGKTFDPTKHEAVAIDPTPIKEEDHLVATVYQPGYIFNKQLLRPARVVVKQYTAVVSVHKDDQD